MAKPSKGFNQPFPDRLADGLARKWGRMDAVALAFLRARLPDAMRTRNPQDLERVLGQLEEELPRRFPDQDIRADAHKAGRTLNDRSRRQFFAAVSAATGVVLLNSDDPEERTPGVEALAGGALGIAAGLTLLGRTRKPPAPLGVTRRTRPGRGIIPAMGRVSLPPPAGVFPPVTFPPGPPSSHVIAQIRGVVPGATAMVKVNANPLLFVDAYADRTTGYISALRDGVVEGVRDQVVREVVQGTGDPEELTRNLLRQWQREGVPSIIATPRGYRARVETHAALIARDQIGTLQMELTRERQLAAGITHFKWVTRGDSRVRPSHQDRANKEYSWAEGADGQFPGGPINCRCHAQAVVKPPAIRAAEEFVPLMTEGPVTAEPSQEFRRRRPE